MSRMERFRIYAEVLKSMRHDYAEMLMFNTGEEVGALRKSVRETLDYGKKHGWD